MTTDHKPHGPIPPLPQIIASDGHWQAARKICAERHDGAMKASYLAGEQDLGWAMRHQMALDCPVEAVEREKAEIPYTEMVSVFSR